MPIIKIILNRWIYCGSASLAIGKYTADQIDLANANYLMYLFYPRVNGKKKREPMGNLVREFKGILVNFREQACLYLKG